MTVLDRVFFRPMPPAFVSVTRLSTLLTSPPLAGRYGRLRGEIPTGINVLVDGNNYAATVNADGTWTIAQGVITPVLAVDTYDVTATASFTGGPDVVDPTSGELIVESAMSAYEVGPGTDVAYGSSVSGVAYGFKP